MGHVKDLWTKPGPGGKRVRSARHGKGKRWLARWVDPLGEEKSKAFASKDAAQAHVSVMDVEIRSGTYIDPKLGKQTFKEYAERWRADQLHHRAATAEQAESRLRLHVYPQIGARALADLRRPHVQACVNVMAETLAPSTVEVVYGYIATVCKSAMLDGVIGRTPCTKINLPEIVRKKLAPLTLAQVQEICGRMPARYRAAGFVAAATGLRQGELFGLKVGHMEGPPGRIVLRVEEQVSGGATKTRAGERKIPLGVLASEAISRHLETYGPGRDGHIFSTPRGTAVPRKRASETWRAAIAGMGLRPRSGWHELRHHHASMLISAGVSVIAIADRLGHRDPSETLRTYGHLWPSDTAKVTAAVDAALSSLLADGTGTERAA